MTLTSSAAPQPGTWDPLANPYTTWKCRGGRHEHCRGGLLYYPH